jgi:ubiquinone/menaquinone biosynthesis C-methylase UbiE
MTAPPEDHARRAYDALAPAYDLLTSGHDHDRWTALIEGCARDAGLTGTRLLDVACGTGNTLASALDRGYDVTGVDISEGMLEQARAKLGGAVRLVEADVRRLPALGEFDLVWCLGDALNYLAGEDELAAAFAGIRRNLDRAGVVVFDVNTLGTFRAVYTSLLAVPTADRVIVLEGHGAPDLPSGGTATATIDRLEREATGWWRRTRSEHHHHHHAEATVRAALARGGLACVRVLGTDTAGTLEAPLDELRHAKAVYVARHDRGAPGP